MISGACTGVVTAILLLPLNSATNAVAAASGRLSNAASDSGARRMAEPGRRASARLASDCHQRRTCPSVAHTYLWRDRAGQQWDCAARPDRVARDYSPPKRESVIQFELGGPYAGQDFYNCELVGRGPSPPGERLVLESSLWTRYVPVHIASQMAATVGRDVMPRDGLAAIYLPGWLPGGFKFMGWSRRLDVRPNQVMPLVAVDIQFAARSSSSASVASWSTARTDHRYKPCTGQLFESHKKKLRDRIIGYGNFFTGQTPLLYAANATACFPDGYDAEFSFETSKPLPAAALEKIARSVVRGTAAA